MSENEQIRWEKMFGTPERAANTLMQIGCDFINDDMDSLLGEIAEFSTDVEMLAWLTAPETPEIAREIMPMDE